MGYRQRGYQSTNDPEELKEKWGHLSNVEVLEHIGEIDDDVDMEVTDWETDFINSTLSQNFALTAKQLAAAYEMFEKYIG